MTEKTKYKWWDFDRITKIITIVLSAFALYIGIWQFNRGQKSLQKLEYNKIFKSDSLKAEQRFVEKKLEVYSNIGESVGIILSSNNIDTAFKKNVTAFEKIYYGEAILIEDTAVNKIMKHFKFSIYDYMQGYISKVQLNEIGMALCDTMKTAIWNKKTVYNKNSFAEDED